MSMGKREGGIPGLMGGTRSDKESFMSMGHIRSHREGIPGLMRYRSKVRWGAALSLQLVQHLLFHHLITRLPLPAC